MDQIELLFGVISIHSHRVNLLREGDEESNLTLTYEFYFAVPDGRLKSTLAGEDVYCRTKMIE